MSEPQCVHRFPKRRGFYCERCGRLCRSVPLRAFRSKRVIAPLNFAPTPNQPPRGEGEA